MILTIAHMEEVGGEWREQLVRFQSQPALVEAIARRVDAFFLKYPGLERTELAAGFISGLALQEFRDAAALAAARTAPQLAAA